MRVSSSMLPRLTFLLIVPLLVVSCESVPHDGQEASVADTATVLQVKSLYIDWLAESEVESGIESEDSDAKGVAVERLNERFAALLEMNPKSVAQSYPELARALSEVRRFEVEPGNRAPNGAARIGDHYYDSRKLEAVLAVLAPEALGQPSDVDTASRTVSVRALGPLSPRFGSKTVILEGESTTDCVWWWTSWHESTASAAQRFDLTASIGPGACWKGGVTVRDVELFAHMVHQGKNYYSPEVSLHPREFSDSRTFHRGLPLQTLASIVTLTNPTAAKPQSEVTIGYEVEEYRRSDECRIAFDDGTSTVVDCGGKSIVHSYDKAGEYEPSMQVTSASGRLLDQRKSDSGPVVVHSGIDVAVDSMQLVGSGLVYPGDSVRFDFDLVNAEFRPLECTVGWGDGDSDVFDCTSARTTPSHAYSVALLDEGIKNYLVTLSVRDATDSTGDAFRPLVVFSLDFRPEIESFTFNGQEVSSASVESDEVFEIGWKVADYSVEILCMLRRSSEEVGTEEREVDCSGATVDSMANDRAEPVSVTYSILARPAAAGTAATASETITVSVSGVPLPTASARFSDSDVETSEKTTFTVTGSGSGITCERRLWNTERDPGPFYGSGCSETASWSTFEAGEWKLEFRVTDEFGRTDTDSDRITVH